MEATLILLGLWLFPIALPPPGQDAPREVGCPTCEAMGRISQECLACHGEKTLPCRRCTRVPVDWRRFWDRDETCDEAKVAEARKSWLAVEESLEKLDETMNRRRTPGREFCPASCRGGKVFVQGKDECRYCQGKGDMPCPNCARKGKLDCSECAGRGRVERACEDCLGSGRLANPAAVPTELRGACSWCGGSEVRACSDCGPEGHVDAVCRTCRGKKEIACSECLGSTIRPCNKCNASGNLKAFFGAKLSNDCDKCDRKGRIPCRECTKGSVQCKTCLGVGRAVQTCLACSGDRQRPCSGCFRGSFRHWEIAAQLLAGADPAAAKAFLATANERLEAFFELRSRVLAHTKAERDAVERELLAARRRLEHIASSIPGDR
jgi:hypothetical protein